METCNLSNDFIVITSADNRPADNAKIEADQGKNQCYFHTQGERSGADSLKCTVAEFH